MARKVRNYPDFNQIDPTILEAIEFAEHWMNQDAGVSNVVKLLQMRYDEKTAEICRLYLNEKYPDDEKQEHRTMEDILEFGEIY